MVLSPRPRSQFYNEDSEESVEKQVLYHRDPKLYQQEVTRNVRKKTLRVFVESIEGTNRVKCLLGCLREGELLTFSASNTSNIRQHLANNHPGVLNKWLECQDSRRSYDECIVEALAEGERLRGLQIRQQRSINAFLTKKKQLPNRTEVELTFLMWALMCRIPRRSLNHPALDLALHKSGANVLPNRQDLQLAYLPELDRIVSKRMREELQQTLSVSVVSDGWADQGLLAWLGVSVAYIDNKWTLQVSHLDLIPIHGQSTIPLLSSILHETVSFWVPNNALIATTTTDGAANELGAARQLVKPGNNIHCVAHLIQLCVRDVTIKQSNIVQMLAKAHDLVTVIR